MIHSVYRRRLGVERFLDSVAVLPAVFVGAKVLAGGLFDVFFGTAVSFGDALRFFGAAFFATFFAKVGEAARARDARLDGGESAFFLLSLPPIVASTWPSFFGADFDVAPFFSFVGTAFAFAFAGERPRFLSASATFGGSFSLAKGGFSGK